MKRIFAFVICAVLLLCTFPIVALAEGEETEAVEQETTLAETEATEAIEQEPPPTESAPAESVLQEPTLSEKIVGYIKEHAEELYVIGSIIVYSIYDKKKQKVTLKSIATVNNNAVDVATNSQRAIDNSNEKMEQMASVVVGYEEKIVKMLSAFEKNAAEKQTLEELIAGYKTVIEKLLTECRVNSEEKQKLEQTLTEVHAHLKTAKLANVELANEVAELLVLANIPNAKKEELYARHRAAVGALAEAEKTEAITNDGQKAG